MTYIKIKKIDSSVAKKNYNPHLKILRRNPKLTYENIVIASDMDVDRRKPVYIIY